MFFEHGPLHTGYQFVRLPPACPCAQAWVCSYYSGSNSGEPAGRFCADGPAERMLSQVFSATARQVVRKERASDSGLVFSPFGVAGSPP